MSLDHSALLAGWQNFDAPYAASMTVTQYLGTGSLSRGRMTITRQLNTIVSTPPYLRDEHDREAVIQGIVNLRETLKGVANLTWITPPSNITVEAFVDSVSTRSQASSEGETSLLENRFPPPLRVVARIIGSVRHSGQPRVYSERYSDSLTRQARPSSAPMTDGRAVRLWST